MKVKINEVHKQTVSVILTADDIRNAIVKYAEGCLPLANNGKKYTASGNIEVHPLDGITGGRCDFEFDLSVETDTSSGDLEFAKGGYIKGNPQGVQCHGFINGYPAYSPKEESNV